MVDSLKNRVLIMGGGSGGLLTAHILKKLNIPYAIFEQDPAFDSRPRDWDFGIYWAQSPLLQCLPEDITYRKVVATQVDDLEPTEDFFMPIYDLSTGEEMIKIPIPYAMRLRRREFIRLLKEEGILDVQVCFYLILPAQRFIMKYGKRLAGIDTDGQAVTATFTDGTTEQGGLIIGAEGAHSVVRKFLLGPEKAALKPSPIVLTMVMTKLPPDAVEKIRGLHERMSTCFHPEGVFAWFGSHERFSTTPSSEWTFTLMLSWSEPTSATTIARDMVRKPNLETIRTAKTIAQKFCDPFRSIWEAVPDDAPVWHNRMSSWPTEEWDNRNGRFTLVGDAAHAMLPHRGQGLNNAIHDVASLLEALRAHYDRDGEAPFKKALEAYEKEMWKRGREAVIMSDENAEALHDWGKLKESPLWKLGIKPKKE
ncbi:fad binding domain-containing protein [Moniliophthora roreri MCA 2997]|uniref:Fad binding domain-containing protein n=1 Tax=Moniliophthora roreri (strain MCA 2997) TaxID=1381753 RepID=V2WF54_MONRO|nr:fad binding domain-containing protein [Moniliophthora roreri MCA 2997]